MSRLCLAHHLLLPIAKVQRHHISPIDGDTGWQQRKSHLSAKWHTLLIDGDTDGRYVRV
jgi:hypothetical protein